MTHGTLYMIATPLGNLGDITLRALDKLKTLPVFFAEDSRELLKLLDAYQVPRGDRRIFSYANHNMKEATAKAMEWLRKGTEVGFASDRGTPGISDPGALLVQSARAEGIPVLPLPGASAVTSLLSVSGFTADRFLFLGFLPLGQKERTANWERVAEFDATTCFLESPKRIRETLGEMAALFPLGEVCLGREMTKVYEEYRRFALADLPAQSLGQRGEYTVVFQPHAQRPAPPEAWREEVRRRGLSDKLWSKETALRFGLTASEIYNALQREKRREP